MIRTILKSALTIILCSITLFSAEISAQQNKADSKKTTVSVKSENIQIKIGRLLDKSGSGFSKISDGIWTVPYKGNSLKNFDVIIVADKTSGLVISFVLVAKKSDLRISQNLLYELLKFNHTADRIKVGIDEEGDLNVRIDENGRLIDLQALEEMLEQTAAASDELYGKISNSLISVP